jgi:hypothetical protein
MAKDEQNAQRVTVAELSAALGCCEEDVAEIVRGPTGIEIERAVAPDFAGRPSVPIECATLALSRTLAARERHADEWASYQAYLAEQAADAAAERERIAREAREQEQRKLERMSAEQAVEAEKVRAVRVAREQERADARRGNPKSFDQFKERS